MMCPAESSKPTDNRLTGAERRELIRRGHALHATVTAGRQGLTDAFIAQTDRTMQKIELLKVRIDAESGDEATLLAMELAQRLGATLVQRVGRVALFYRPVQSEDESE